MNKETAVWRLDAATEHILQAMVQIAIVADGDVVPSTDSVSGLPRNGCDVALNRLEKEARHMLAASRNLAGLPDLSWADRGRVLLERRITIRDEVAS